MSRSRKAHDARYSPFGLFGSGTFCLHFGLCGLVGSGLSGRLRCGPRAPVGRRSWGPSIIPVRTIIVIVIATVSASARRWRSSSYVSGRNSPSTETLRNALRQVLRQSCYLTAAQVLTLYKISKSRFALMNTSRYCVKLASKTSCLLSSPSQINCILCSVFPSKVSSATETMCRFSAYLSPQMRFRQ